MTGRERRHRERMPHSDSVARSSPRNLALSTRSLHGCSDPVDGEVESGSPVNDVAVSKSDWKNLVVICSGMAWDGPALSEKQLASRLSKYAPVLYVDPPISMLTPLRRPEFRAALAEPRLREVAPRIMRLTPLALPGVGRRILRDLAIRSTRMAIRRATTTLGGDVAAMIVASLDDLFGSAGERCRLLWGTDDFSAGGELMGVSPDWLRRRELSQLQRANLLCAVSSPLADKWHALSGKQVSVIHNGCDTTLLGTSIEARRPDDVMLKDPIAVFVGHLSERIDLAFLDAVAAVGVSVLLVGNKQSTFEVRKIENLLRKPNVQWVGPKRFDELPGYLGASRVGLTPYARSEFNDASFPLKTLDYLAAGLPVVSSNLPATSQLKSDAIRIAQTPTDFSRMVLELATSPPSQQLRETAMSFAKGHDWEARAGDFAGLIGLTP